MANYKTRAITDDEFKLIIDTIRKGFTTADGVKVKPNIKIATALIFQGNTGLRIGDVVNFRLSDIVFEDGRYHFNNLVEEKTKKLRTNTVPAEIYTYMQSYALEQGISPKAKLFPVAVRTVQNHLKETCDYLGLKNVNTHSFRKRFAMSIYKNSKDLELLRTLLNHSSLSVTQHYLSVEPEQITQALQQIVSIPT